MVYVLFYALRREAAIKTPVITFRRCLLYKSSRQRLSAYFFNWIALSQVSEILPETSSFDRGLCKFLVSSGHERVEFVVYKPSTNGHIRYMLLVTCWLSSASLNKNFDRKQIPTNIATFFHSNSINSIYSRFAGRKFTQSIFFVTDLLSPCKIEERRGKTRRCAACPR